jgi:hypothetical protein
MAKSITRARRVVPEFLSDLKNDLTPMAREAIAELYDLMRDLDRRIGLLRIPHLGTPDCRVTPDRCLQLAKQIRSKIDLQRESRP